MKILFIILPIILMIGFGALAFWLFSDLKVRKEKPVKKTRKSRISGQLIEEEYIDDEVYYEVNKGRLIGAILSSIGTLVSLVVLIVVPASIHQVEAGEVAVVKVWGDAKEIRTSGVYFDNWISHKYEIYDAKVQQVEVKTSAYSNDKQTMDLEVFVQYQIQQDKVVNISKEYGGLEALESRITTVTTERTKSVLSKYTAEELIQDRQSISEEVTQYVINAIKGNYYVDINTVVLTNIDFSDTFEKSVEDAMVAQQEVVKAQAEKEKAVIKAEQELETAKKEAEALLEKAKKEAEAKKELADAEAYSTTTLAQAEADALQLVENAWNSMSADVKEAVLKKYAIEQWNGELPDMMIGDEFLTWLLGSVTP